MDELEFVSPLTEAMDFVESADLQQLRSLMLAVSARLYTLSLNSDLQVAAMYACDVSLEIGRVAEAH